jgi:UrcA family protein
MTFATAALRKPFIVAVASIATFASVNGAAHADDSVPQVKVNYSDLNLESSSDAQRLYKRLRAASYRVCDAYSGRDLRRTALKRECTAQALDRAVLAVNHPAVLALHDRQVDVRVAQKDGKQQPRG